MSFLNGSRSNFPQSLDQILEMFDLPPSQKQNASRYQELKVKSSLTTAEQEELNQLTVTLQNYIISPERFNYFGDICIKLQSFFRDNVEGYIDTKQQEMNQYVDGKKNEIDVEINKFEHRGTYNPAIQYFQRNLVDYNDGTGTKVYLALQNTLGNVPTNTTFWRLVTIRGEKGDSGQDGIGLVFKGSWNNTTVYNKDEAVQYGNILFASLIENNIGNTPNLTQDTAEWGKALSSSIITTRLRGQRTIGSASNTVNFITGQINAFNPNTDDLEVIVNTTSVEQGIDYNINSDNQSITRIGGSWASGTIFYFRVIRNMLSDLVFSDGQSIQAGTVSKNKLSVDVQDDLNKITTLETATQTNQNQINILSQDITNVDTDLQTHKAETMPHGSTVTATPNRLIHRDANGRAQVANGVTAADIATFGQINNLRALIRMGAM